MADFVQTMNDWKRMCLSYKSCSDCPMMDADGSAHILCSEGGIQIAVPEIQEAVIKKWAAEHTEPVYPTWWEWLENMEIVSKAKSEYSEIFDTICVGTRMFDPIPADIAQKLGIEPKEG